MIEEIIASDPEDQDPINEYLKNGGKVTVCVPGERTPDLPVGQWRRKAGRPKANPGPRGKK